jgi:signal transduction histidine kinase
MLLLTAAAMTAAIGTRRAADRMKRATLEGDAYEQARFAVASEESLERKYRLEPGPDVLVRYHAAARSLEAALRREARIGDHRDRALVASVLATHTIYLEATTRLYAAVDAHDTKRVLAIDGRAEPLFHEIEAKVLGGASQHRLSVLRSLESLTRLERLVFVGTPITFALGLLTLGILSTLLARRRRVEEAGRLELAHLEAGNATQADQIRGLRELDDMKDSIIASISHELRTPLTSIRGYLELVLTDEVGDLTDEQRSFLGVADRNSERLLRLVGDLLLVAQMRDGTFTLHTGDVDLHELVLEALAGAQPGATDKEITVVHNTEALPVMSGDRVRLGQALDNLISNAVKFTPEGGQIEVRLDLQHGRAVLEVADTGVGISVEDQKQLFERFFRTGSAEREAIPGTGLGLSIVKAIIESHSGTISLKSEPGVGTTFRVELPLTQGEASPAQVEIPAA